MEKPPVIPAAQELQLLTKYLETISVNILQTQLHICEDLLIFMQFLQEKLICNFSCKKTVIKISPFTYLFLNLNQLSISFSIFTYLDMLIKLIKLKQLNAPVLNFKESYLHLIRAVRINLTLNLLFYFLEQEKSDSTAFFCDAVVFDLVYISCLYCTI